MKKSTLIAATILIPIGLMSFGYLNVNWTPQPPTDFVYDLAPRYNRTFTKTEMESARKFSEFDNLDALHPKDIISFRSVNVMIIDDQYEPIQQAAGNTGNFNAAQLKLLQSAPYSADVLIRAEYVIRNNNSGELEDSYTTPHITVVPETQVECPGGYEAFINYLKEKSAREVTLVQDGKLQPGKVRFTINEKGTIENVLLISSSGYDEIDKRMVELVLEAPGTWNSALNANGETVEQQLVFSFGIVGC